MLDAIVIKPVDVTFDLIWRHGSSDVALSSWTEHYDPLGQGLYDAQAFEYDKTAPAIDWTSGDQLVFRYTGNSASPSAYIPNGDGAVAHGRIPHIALP